MATAPAADARFIACLAQTLKWEGGYSNDKYDPGGATMKGIIQREYDAYRKRAGKPKQSVRNITDEEVEYIYFNSYWDEVRADELPAGVDEVVFDFGVNSGTVTSIKGLQRCLGVAVDGQIGQETLHAVEAADPDALVQKIMDYRRSYLRSLKTFWRFGKGWMTRCDGIEKDALAAAGVHPIALVQIPEVQPHADPDVQSAAQGRAWENPPSSTAATPEGRTAIGVGAGGTVTTALAVTHACQQSYVPGQGIDWGTLFWNLATSPELVAGAVGIVAAGIIWSQRKWLLHTEAK